MNAIQTLSTTTIDNDDDNAFINTLNELLAEDIVSDYMVEGMRSTISLSATSKNNNNKVDGNKDENIHDDHDYGIQESITAEAVASDDLVDIKKNTNEDHPVQGTIIKTTATVSNGRADSNEEKNDDNNSSSSINSKNSKSVKSQYEIINSSITSSVRSNQSKSKNSNAATDATTGTITPSSSPKQNDKKSNDKNIDFYSEIQKFEQDEIKLSLEKQKLISFLEQEFDNYRDLVDNTTSFITSTTASTDATNAHNHLDIVNTQSSSLSFDTKKKHQLLLPSDLYDKVIIDNNKKSKTSNMSNINNNIDNVLEALNERKKDIHEFMKDL